MSAPSARACIGEISSDQYSAAVAPHDSEYKKQISLSRLMRSALMRKNEYLSVFVYTYSILCMCSVCVWIP